MKETVEVIRVSEDQKSILRQLLELYEYDFSEFNHEGIHFSLKLKVSLPALY